MKQYILDNFFKIYSIGKFPIKYITQNKEENTLNESCFKKLLLHKKEKDVFSEHKGFFVAVTNDMIVRKLRKSKNIKLIDIKIPRFIATSNVNGLKKYLVGENTLCHRCKDRENCTARELVNKKSKEMQWHLIFIKA